MGQIQKLIELLKGKKTYIVAAVMAIATFVHLMGWIDAPTLAKVEVFLASIGLATLRAGITK